MIRNEAKDLAPVPDGKTAEARRSAVRVENPPRTGSLWRSGWVAYNRPFHR